MNWMNLILHVAPWLKPRMLAPRIGGTFAENVQAIIKYTRENKDHNIVQLLTMRWNECTWRGVASSFR